MPQLILALDQGTTSSRAILFDEAGQLLETAQQEFPQIFPRPGWVEHDPHDIWRTQRDVARAVLDRAKVSAADVAAIGITNQRETTLIWDRRTGEPVYNAIVWQCRRTAPMCDALRAEGFDAVIRAKTGLVTDAYFSGTKVAWLLDNVPGTRPRAERGELAFGTVDTWLLWNLSGGALHVTDPTNASRTLLYNIYKGDWDDEILAHLNIPRSLLPEVRPSSAVYGESVAHVLGASIPLAGMAGDQQAALFGQACHAPGMAKNTYGTGSFVLLNTGESGVESKSNLVTTIAWQLEGGPVTYALEGSIFVTGAAVQWLRDGLGIIGNAAEVEPLAGSVESADGVYFVPAFVGLGAPHWDAYARGTLIGMTRGTTRAHIARATLDAIALQSCDVLDAMHADSGITLSALRVDGGAAKNDLLMQIQADLLGVPVQRPAVTETTALGAAYLAGLAVGVWPDTDALARQWTIDRTFEPRMADDERQSLIAGWRRAVERASGWADGA
ncbi:glycerol kinase GlpK [Aggregatilinea lenta]|uniref:glycerol kinase GlpK n=1 Tax=Aggregatilinea lenta TaxID=913108 RepID=UPI000E5A43DC|nr:glycerol kinase GlpK [Aggregatilinea lenta]